MSGGPPLCDQGGHSHVERGHAAWVSSVDKGGGRPAWASRARAEQILGKSCSGYYSKTDCKTWGWTIFVFSSAFKSSKQIHLHRDHGLGAWSLDKRKSLKENISKGETVYDNQNSEYSDTRQIFFFTPVPPKFPYHHGFSTRIELSMYSSGYLP